MSEPVLVQAALSPPPFPMANSSNGALDSTRRRPSPTEADTSGASTDPSIATSKSSVAEAPEVDSTRRVHCNLSSVPPKSAAKPISSPVSSIIGSDEYPAKVTSPMSREPLIDSS